MPLDPRYVHEGCARHPQRFAEFGVTTHYINSMNWRDIVKADQVFGPLCSECRLEFNAWISHRAED
jgi:hypothetical protein